ncbi:MAG: PadR family transcriptional regulator [Acidobacteria bacterium]|nr:MAG: PadR family transcriptional regulator [Acidobacteriota bacterium]
MSQKAYLSHSAAAILQALANGYQYGFDIMDITGLPSGTVYPALRRLEETGFIDSKWEKPGIAQREQRPPRKYYDLTPDGKGKHRPASVQDQAVPSTRLTGRGLLRER